MFLGFAPFFFFFFGPPGLPVDIEILWFSSVGTIMIVMIMIALLLLIVSQFYVRLVDN